MPFSHFLSNPPVLLLVNVCFNLIYPMPVDTVYLIYNMLCLFKAIINSVILFFFFYFSLFVFWTYASSFTLRNLEFGNLSNAVALSN